MRRTMQSISFTISAPGVGLRNKVNTCFLNAVLQALVHTPLIAAYFNSTHGHYPCENQENGDCVVCALTECFHMIRTSETAFAPKIILKLMKRIFKGFVPRRQADAHEFLLALIRKVDRTFGTSNSPPRVGQEKRKFFKSYFQARLFVEVRCHECDIISTHYSKSIGLNLEVTETLEKSIDRHFAPEKVINWACLICLETKNGSSTKKFWLVKAPPVLMLRLGRDTRRAKSKNVAVPEHLCLDAHTKDQAKCSSVRYTLAAMINHHGSSIHSGHYTATVRTDSNSYHLFDDESVRQTTLAADLTSTYVLLYTRDDATSQDSLQPSEDVERRLPGETFEVSTASVFAPPVEEITDEAPAKGHRGTSARLSKVSPMTVEGTEALTASMIGSPTARIPDDSPMSAIRSSMFGFSGPDQLKWVTMRKKRVGSTRASIGPGFSGASIDLAMTPDVSLPSLNDLATPSLFNPLSKEVTDDLTVKSHKMARVLRHASTPLSKKTLGDALNSLGPESLPMLPILNVGAHPLLAESWKIASVASIDSTSLPIVSPLRLPATWMDSDESLSPPRPIPSQSKMQKGKGASLPENDIVRDYRAMANQLLEEYPNDPHLRANAETARRRTDENYAAYLLAKRRKQN